MGWHEALRGACGDARGRPSNARPIGRAGLRPAIAGRRAVRRNSAGRHAGRGIADRLLRRVRSRRPKPTVSGVKGRRFAAAFGQSGLRPPPVRRRGEGQCRTASGHNGSPVVLLGWIVMSNGHADFVDFNVTASRTVTEDAPRNHRLGLRFRQLICRRVIRRWKWGGGVQYRERERWRSRSVLRP